MFKHIKKLFTVIAALSLLFVYACEQSGGQQSKGKSKTLKNKLTKIGHPLFAGVQSFGNFSI